MTMGRTRRPTPTPPLLLLLLLLLLGVILAPIDIVLAQVFPVAGPLQLARAVLQDTARLPCDVRSPLPNDSFILIVWYKQDVVPIFSYDIRDAEKASVWMADYLNGRASFKASTEPATLNIDNVEESDGGEYRCRVDFKKNPTKNLRVNLDVIIPPSRPNIIDGSGRTVGLKAGPYREGGDMRLKCSVTGGRPAPTVRWWRGEKLLDARDGPGDYISVKQNTLVVRNLSRADLNAQFTCTASNNNISQPVSTIVTIDMDLRPLNVTIRKNEEAPLSAGREYEVTCITTGSKPPAKLSWLMDGKLLTNNKEKVIENENMTTSIMTFTPTRLDNDKSIWCRAVNPNYRAEPLEDSLKLNVLYVPILSLKLGDKMNSDDIEEGDDVYFECMIDANPVAYKVVWKHNGNVLQNNAKMGMIVLPNSLALQKINRSQAGNYTCIASNVEGDGFSNVVELKIMYKPICLPEQKHIYGIARHEEAQVVCRVESYPPPLSFSWAFNNTEEMVDVSQSRYNHSSIQAQSVLTYKPTSEMDYGTVLCWATNNIGKQQNACIFHIINAGKPEPPYNCTLTNQTTQSLSVECTAGFDGGQTQHFQLEVYDQVTGQLRANVSANDTAVFNVHNLESGRILRMAVYAANSRGRSEPTLLEGFTLKVAEKQTVRVLFTGTPVPFEITPLLGILIGIIAVLVLCTVTVLMALKVRNDRRAARPGDLPLKKATAPSSEDLYDADDRNPDVVPTNKDSDYQLTGSTAGTPLAVQGTPDGLSTTSLPLTQQPNHLPSYSHNDYNNYPTLPLSGEVTYAELCLARPSTLTTAAGTDTKLASIGGLSSLAGFSSNGASAGGNGTGGGVIVGGNKPSYAKEATVYACIDHNARPPKLDQQLSPPTTMAPVLPPPTSVNIIQDALQLKQQQLHHLQQQQQQQHHPREVVTVRTPLISSQESCV